MNETKPTVHRGFAVRCLHCASEDDIVRLDLADLDKFNCSECGEDFTVSPIRPTADAVAVGAVGGEAIGVNNNAEQRRGIPFPNPHRP